MDYSPAVTHAGLLDMQVCVPADYDDKTVLEFAERSFPCSTTNGWSIRRGGTKALAGQQERCPCAEREGFVHIMLDA